MQNFEAIPFTDIDVNMGFWQKRQQLNREVTVGAVMRQFQGTGRFDALLCQWREGMPNKPHIFYDSDLAKWMESVAYLLEKAPAPELEQVVEEAIDELEKHQTEDGYINSYFTGVEPTKRWSNRLWHELYCAGHLMEAAVAWKHATGRDRFLNMMCRYADYIYKVFVEEKSAAFQTPGHEEIELALVRLYQATGEKRYLDLCRFFIDERGNNDHDPDLGDWARYSQSHAPCKEQDVAEGHSVRACYLYAGMADIARECDDVELLHACEKLFDNIVNRRMYITGGIGSNHAHEAFTADYDLPSETAYTETCAAISLCYFAQRMLMMKNERKYADVIERVIYNGFLSGTSLSGKEFFYTNPLEINLAHHDALRWQQNKDWLPEKQRVEVFYCSCCPPNITRFIASIGDYIYTKKDADLYVQQYIGNTANIAGGTVTICTEYPAKGNIQIQTKGIQVKKLHLRIPGWCANFELNVPYTMENGYAVVEMAGDTEISLVLDMPAQLMEGNPAILDTAGKAALMRGPVVYCIEGVDNGENLGACFINAASTFREEDAPEYGMPVLIGEGWRLSPAQGEWLYRPMTGACQKQELKFIPYYAFANRGETDMRVWVPVRR